MAPSECKSEVTYFKDIERKHTSDLKQIALISKMVFYLGYSFEMCSALSSISFNLQNYYEYL